LLRPNVWFCHDSSYTSHPASSASYAAYTKWAEALEPGAAAAAGEPAGAGEEAAASSGLGRVAKASRRKLAVIECGAGMVIPSCRVEAEDRSAWCNGSLIRINPNDFGVPEEGAEGAPPCSVGLPLGSAEGLRQIASRIPSLAGWRRSAAGGRHQPPKQPSR
jgi:hypothetical protein